MLSKPSWWHRWFGTKKSPYKKKESDWNPIWQKIYPGIAGIPSHVQIKICQHGVEESIHCCNCHEGLIFSGMICRCVGGD